MVSLSAAVFGLVVACACTSPLLGLVVAALAVPGCAVILCMVQEVLRMPLSLSPPKPGDGSATLAGIAACALGWVVMEASNGTGLGIVTGFVCFLGLAVLMGFLFPVVYPDRLAPLREFANDTRPDSARLIENDELIAAGVVVEF